MRNLKIAIADDHRLYTEALATMLNEVKGSLYRVVLIAHDGTELMSKLDHQNPDVLLLDLNMPEMDGLTVLPLVKKEYPEMKVVVLTMYDEAKFIKKVFKLQGDCYFLKTNPFDELLTAIEAVISGQRYTSNGLKVFPRDGENLTNPEFEDDFQLRHSLTPREIEILQLISQAKSNKQIAEDLFISDQTVGVHRKNIMRKLSVSNTAGLIKFALDHNLS